MLEGCDEFVTKPVFSSFGENYDDDDDDDDINIIHDLDGNESVDPSWLRNESGTGSDAALAVKSIPAYVEVADLFIALVPESRRKGMLILYLFVLILIDD